MRATYRVQLNATFGFSALCEIVPYLHGLGISHLYLSPIFQSRADSRHGYDITDHGQINAELGGERGLLALVQTCRAHSMGLLLDIVPNHMAVTTAANSWWLDVLEHGPASRFADYFDIDWTPTRASMRNRLLIPALGSPLGEVIGRRGFSLTFDAASGKFWLHHESLQYPLDPATYPRVFEAIRRHAVVATVPDEAALAQLTGALQAFAALPPAEPCPHETRLLRSVEAQAHRQRLAQLCTTQPTLAVYIHATLQYLQQLPAALYGELLAAVLRAQPYRLAFWRVSGEEINYRRFFDVNELAALRMENRQVFDATHALLWRLWQGGCLDGVRVDHADGLYRPAQYFQRLRQLLDSGPTGRHAWIVAEKILGNGESLPVDWEVDGTTGYDFAAQVSGWLMCGSGAVSLEKLYRRVVGPGPDYTQIAYQSRRQVMRTSLAAEISGLAARLDRLAQRHLDTSDFTLFDLREAIVEVVACFPVYRTYVGDGPVGVENARHIRRATGMALSRKQTAARALQFLERVLLGEFADDPACRVAAQEFTLSFQQVTAPVMAKGIEDTAYYRHPCLLAMNEVGGDPQCRSLSSEALHQANLTRQRNYPCSLLASSTHDTKRGEDARYRLCALTQIPAAWAACLRRWRRLKGQRRSAGSVSATQEYLLLQSLLAIWPLPQAGEDLTQLRARMQEYAIKAAREAKERTSWLDPDTDHEDQLRDYVKLLLPMRVNSGFVRYFRPVIDQAAFFGMLDAVSACVLKFTAPGIPDIYQGNELPAFVLVDPDNRRQPDFGAHARLLEEVTLSSAAVPLAAAATAMLEAWWDGKLKLFVTWRLLTLRREHPDPFDAGAYTPLAVDGTHALHLCAFARECARSTLIVVVSRWAGILSRGDMRAPLGELAWQDTYIRLPASIDSGEYVDALSGRVIRIGPSDAKERTLPAGLLLKTLPCSVLLRDAQPTRSNNSSERPVTP
jgi:(1->4)-alpha-D-glucan 1-alpha-D-glucosylmutase